MVSFESVVPFEHSHHDNNNIPAYAYAVRELAKSKKSPDGCEDDIGVIENGYLLCRSECIRSSDGQLTAHCTGACSQKYDQLSQSHRVEIKYHERQTHEA